MARALVNGVVSCKSTYQGAPDVAYHDSSSGSLKKVRVRQLLMVSQEIIEIELTPAVLRHSMLQRGDNHDSLST